MDIYEEANVDFVGWMSRKNLIAKEPCPKEIGVEWNKISDATFSPIEEAIL